MQTETKMESIVAEPSYNKIVSSLKMMRRSSGFKLSGSWSVGIFDLNQVGITEAQLLGYFMEEVNTYFIGGDSNLTSVLVEGEYYPAIYFLIPSKHKGEIGRTLSSFRITSEE